MRHILFFLLSISGVSLIAEPIPPHVGEFSFTDYASYYRSASNYLSAGTSTTNLPLGGYFQYINDTLSVNYDLLPALRINANLGYGNTTASNPFTTFTGQGMTEGGVAAQYWFRDKRWAIVPTIKAGFPFYRNSVVITSSQPNALIGDGTIWAEGGAWGMFYFHPVTIYGYLGYKYQDTGLASLLTTDVGASYRFDAARVRLGIRGETNVTQDNDTPNPFYRNFLIATADNFSEKFYSINPTLYEAYGEFDWLFTRMFEGGLGFAQSIYGNNAASGYTIEAMFRFRLPTGEAARQSSKQPEFNEPPAISEPIFAPAGVPEDEINPQPRPRTKKQKNMDQMMQDTERSLEK